MGESRVLPGVFIEENAVHLTRTLLHERLHNKASAHLLLIAPTGTADPYQLPIWLRHRVHIFTRRTELHFPLLIDIESFRVFVAAILSLVA